MELTERQRIDKQRILTPAIWPRWPLLPIKKYKPRLETACIVSPPDMRNVLEDDEEITICLAGLFSGAYSEVGWYEKVPRKVYTNIYDLLADGWMVD